MRDKIVFIVCGLLATFSWGADVEALRAKLAGLSEEGHYRTKAILRSELGTELYNQGRMAEAAEEFDRALLEKPSRAQKKHIYLYLGKSLESSGRLDKAIPAYEMALKLDRRNWKRHRDLAFLSELSGLYQKAINHYLDAYRRNSIDASIPFGLARSWRKWGHYSEASEWLEKANALELSKKDYLLEKSLILEGQGHYVEALAALNLIERSEMSNSQLVRSIYLAVINETSVEARTFLIQLKGRKASQETIKFYENLIEWGGSTDKTAVSLTAKDPSLQALFNSLFIK